MIGVDISIKMLEIYKSKNPLAIAGDIEKLPFKNIHLILQFLILVYIGQI